MASQRWRAAMECMSRAWTCRRSRRRFCVVDRSGSVVREGVVNLDLEAISVYVRSKAPGAVRIGLGDRTDIYVVWTELKRFGLPVMCLDAPRHAKAVLKMQINKSDRNVPSGYALCQQTAGSAGARQGYRQRSNRSGKDCPCRDDGDGSLSDFLRAPERPTAIRTLNRQRHPTPSCGGLTPTAEKRGPGKDIVGELDTQTRINNICQQQAPTHSINLAGASGCMREP